MATLQTMELIKDEGKNCWMVDCSDPEVKMLFGTSIIPTAYTLAMPAHKVRIALSELNPKAIIILPFERCRFMKADNECSIVGCYCADGPENRLTCRAKEGGANQ